MEFPELTHALGELTALIEEFKNLTDDWGGALADLLEEQLARARGQVPSLARAYAEIYRPSENRVGRH